MAINSLSVVLVALLSTILLHSVLGEDSHGLDGAAAHMGREFVGGVYAMSNNVTENTLVVYARRPDGTLSLLDNALRTGGRGAVLSTGTSGSDPLISAFSVIIINQRFVLVVNAGSNSVSVFEILPDFNLELKSVRQVPGFGPVSIAYTGNLVYVATADDDGEFDAPTEQKGVLSGFRLTSSGRLLPIRGSIRQLSFRPSTIQFSADGRSLVASDSFAPLNAATSGELAEILVFRVSRFGLLSRLPVSTATSTRFGNSNGRNLPTAIGFDMTKVGSTQFVIVPEVRVVGPDGTPSDFQTSSVSIWKLTKFGRLIPVQLDVLIGSSLTSGQLAACWVEISSNRRMFWVSNTGSGTISTFSFRRGRASLAVEEAASGPLPVDLWATPDGKFVYQLFAGSVGAFRVSRRGSGPRLIPIQNPMNVPELNPQGIVAF
eukprot:GFKZ01011326.1.p1 GENE.GFKZ01011326.1~~GFKZ01011326.1.p1  ORF type:complete len:432 (+),score=46.13 GFKZ01011326.1:218-1513(+)